MKLLQLEVHNIHGAGEVDLIAAASNLCMVGPGVVRAVECALYGKREMGTQWPDKLLKDGKEYGYVKLILSGDEEMQEPLGFILMFQVTRVTGGTGVIEEINLMDSSGEAAPEPRTLLRRMCMPFNHALQIADTVEYSPKLRLMLARDDRPRMFTEDIESLDAELQRCHMQMLLELNYGESHESEH